MPVGMQRTMSPVTFVSLRDIASEHVHTVSPDVSLGEAAAILAGQRISSLVVTDAAGKPLGIVTESDLVRRVCRPGAAQCPVAEAMSSPLLTVSDRMDFSAAQIFMAKRGIRHLGLVDARERLVGLVTATDFRRHVGNYVFDMIQKIDAVIEPGGSLIDPEQPLAYVLRMMAAGRLDHVLAGREGVALGILTERDVPRLLASGIALETTPLSAAMASPLHHIPATATVAEAAARMESLAVRHLVVLDAGQGLLGVVSQRRIFEKLGILLLEEVRSRLQDQLETIMLSAGVGVWEYDQGSGEIIRTPSLNGLMKLDPALTREKLPQMLQRVHPDDRLRVLECYRGVRAGQQDSFRIDYRVRDGDGLLRWISSRGRIVERDETGRPNWVAGVLVDIDATKATEEKLAVSERRFRKLLSELPVPLCYANRPGEVLFTNQAFISQFGYTQAEVSDLETWWQRAFPDEAYRERARSDWKEAVSHAGRGGGVIRPAEYRITSKDGRERTVEVSGILLEDNILTTFTDVTEHRQQQGILEFSNAVLQRISTDVPLVEILETIAGEIEALEPSTHVAVQLLDEQQQRLHFTVNLSLPAEFVQSANYQAIGPQAGACGTAAFNGQPVFSVDISQDPLWLEAQARPLDFGLAACLSWPIRSSTGQVLGVFGIFWHQSFPEISPLALRYVESATRLAAIAIESRRRDAELRKMADRLQGQLDELHRWQRVTLGREQRVLELKEEVNALRVRLGEAPRYGSVMMDGDE